MILARPRTSSGPGTGAHGFSGLPAPGTRPNYDKRMSKDDLDLMIMGRAGRGGAGQKTKGGMGGGGGFAPFRSGVGPRGSSLPTPEQSPERYFHHHHVLDRPPPPPSIPSRMATPESLVSVDLPIGVAIGSPSQTPTSFMMWPPSVQEPESERDRDRDRIPSQLQQRAASASALSSRQQQTATPAVQRQKSQRRKLFGGLFGSRRHTESPPPPPPPPVLPPSEIIPEAVSSSSSSRSDDAVAGTVAVAVTAPTAVSLSPPRSRSRSRTVSERSTPNNRHRTLIRADTSSGFGNGNRRAHGDGYLREGGGPHGGGGGGGGGSSGPVSTSSSSSSSASSGLLLLDVEIPDIRLERYSVMFSGVLNSGEKSSSSLLARRQATLERLKMLKDGLIPEEVEVEVEVEVQDEERDEVMGLTRPRRATSPHPAMAKTSPSPSFSLFPAAHSTAVASSFTHTPAQTPASGLMPARAPSFSRPFPRRSNTSPAHLSSPSRSTFDPNLAGPCHEQQQQNEPTPTAAYSKPFKAKKTVTVVSPRTMDERSRAARVERLRAARQSSSLPSLRSPAPPPAPTSPPPPPPLQVGNTYLGPPDQD